jgi:hypothetical protein
MSRSSPPHRAAFSALVCATDVAAAAIPAGRSVATGQRMRIVAFIKLEI